MTGKRKIFKQVYLLIIIEILAFHANAQTKLNLEEKALAYFCDNITEIDSKLNDCNIRFTGRTTGKLSRVYNIAECLGEINLMKNEIPNELELDGLTAINCSAKRNAINLSRPSKCSFLKKYIFAPYNKRIFSLSVFNAIEYHGNYYVELYLINKNLNEIIICIEFDQEKKAIKHYVSSKIY